MQKNYETISLSASNSTITKFIKYKLDLSLVDQQDIKEILLTSNALVITYNEIVDISELAAKPPPMTSFLQCPWKFQAETMTQSLFDSTEEHQSPLSSPQ